MSTNYGETAKIGLIMIILLLVCIVGVALGTKYAISKCGTARPVKVQLYLEE